MSEQNNDELTAEQFKARRMRANFANRVLEYEDKIADLETQLAIVQQQLQAAQQPEPRKMPTAEEVAEVLGEDE